MRQIVSKFASDRAKFVGDGRFGKKRFQETSETKGFRRRNFFVSVF